MRVAWMCLGLLLAGCGQRTLDADQQAYIWQRQWTPAVSAALHSQQREFAGWRVLGLQVIGAQLLVAKPDLVALAGSSRPTRLVVRIEGARLPIAVPALLTSLMPLIERWRASGVALDGIEIDHDCATAALTDYALWLGTLRAALPADLKLSITALPSWLDSGDLTAVLAQVDDSVLQVHAVERPDRALFDAERALTWTLAYAARTSRDFRVALPAYSVRVATDPTGRVNAVDAETDIDHSGPAGRELRADPNDVARYLARVDAAAPAHLRGFLWFRLPVIGDRRGWSATTLAAVIRQQPLAAHFVVSSIAHANGSLDLRVRNDGNLDSSPPSIKLPEQCRLGDGLGQYRLHSGASLELVADPSAWVAAGDSARVGWVRCNGALDREWVVQ